MKGYNELKNVIYEARGFEDTNTSMLLSEPFGGIINCRDNKIRLADVLLAFEVGRELLKDRLWVINKGYINHTSFDYQKIYGQAEWNLKDDNLDNQTDETKQFLIDLLKNKKKPQNGSD